MSSCLWGGGFSEKPNEFLMRMNNSLSEDAQLWNEDLQGSAVYAEALCDVGIINTDELKLILHGLEEICNDWKTNSVQFLESDEDVHTLHERILIEKIGAVGEKLHTGRSRNDQIAIDMCLWMKKNIKVLEKLIIDLIRAIVSCSIQNLDLIMPGYTHLQRAQPIHFSHWILSYGFFMQENVKKLEFLYQNVNSNMPLGSGAIAGNPFHIKREKIANKLGFQGITSNSIYAISGRDNICDFLYQMALNALHLSRMAEDLILYSTIEFGFISISESYTTGSSLMPNKRNPDSLELIRGISALLTGNVTSMLTLLKGLPSAYNKDLQYDKKLLFDSFNKLVEALTVMEGVVRTLKVNKEHCLSSLSFDMLATDVAYYLTRKGVPFRTAHHITSRLVSYANSKGIGIHEVSMVNLKNISEYFDESISEIWDFANSCKQYSAVGGTSKESIKLQIDKLEQFIQAFN